MNEDFDWGWYIQNLWQRENAGGLKAKEGVGGYKNGRYFPYKTPNGNTDVGPGFDLDMQTPEFVKKAYSEGYEQTHAASSYLSDITGNPRLRIEDFNAKEWVPNPDHPVAAKYKDAFMQANRHGKSPEETWANYMGSKATNMSWNDFRYDNAHREGIYPPIGFIKDYKQHLIDTYNPMSLYYNP